jgi:hypothetical protein
MNGRLEPLLVVMSDELANFPYDLFGSLTGAGPIDFDFEPLSCR